MQPTDKELAEARELLAAQYDRDEIPHVANCIRRDGELTNHERRAIRAIAAALRTARQVRDGGVVVTRDEDGEIVMVSRQNSDGEVLEVIASTCHAGGKATPASASEARLRELSEHWLRLSDEKLDGAKSRTLWACAKELRDLLDASGEGRQGDGLERDMDFYERGVRDGETMERQRLATQQQAGQAVDSVELADWFYEHLMKLADWDYKKIPKLREDLRALSANLKLYTTPQTPDGYVLVPREPTEAMIEASMIAIPIAKRIPAGSTFRVYGARAWEAMIAASEASGGEVGNG